jgi:hypothetical protein
MTSHGQRRRVFGIRSNASNIDYLGQGQDADLGQLTKDIRKTEGNNFNVKKNLCRKQKNMKRS